MSKSNGNVTPSMEAIIRGAFPSGICAGNMKIRGFSFGEELTKRDGKNKENIAVGVSAKVTNFDTEVEVVLGGSDERSALLILRSPGARTRVPGIVFRL